VVHYEFHAISWLQTEPLSDFLRHGHLALLPVALDRAIFAFSSTKDIGYLSTRCSASPGSAAPLAIVVQVLLSRVVNHGMP